MVTAFNQSRKPTLKMAHIQQGIAALLLIILVGIGVLAVSASMLHGIKNAQERQIAAHAQVNAQTLAWNAAENLRLYFASLTPAQLEATAIDANFSLSADANLQQNAKITGKKFADNKYTFTVQITAKDISAASSAVLQTVYAVTPSNSSGTIVLDGAMFKGPTSISGGIDFYGKPGEQGLDIFVDGTLTASSTSFKGVKRMTVTGNLDITNGTFEPKEIVSNGNVTIESATVLNLEFIWAIGKVKTKNGTISTLKEIHSNSDISLGHTGSVKKSIDTLGNVKINDGSPTQHGTITAGGTVEILKGEGSSFIRSYKNVIWSSDGDKDLISNTTIWAKEGITCETTKAFKEIYTPASKAKGCSPKQIEGTPSFDLPEPLKPITLAAPLINVWALKESANYAFEYVNNEIKVTIKNINSINDGSYKVIVDSKSAYICTNMSCTTKATICNADDGGGATLAECLKYDVAKNEWQLKGYNIAPGAVWFKGNLLLGAQTDTVYFNTFMATHDIKTSNSSTVVIAPNVAGYNGLCVFEGKEKRIEAVTETDSNNDNNNEEPKVLNIASKYSPHFFNPIYPKNFCNPIEKKLKENTLGNIALVAGGKESATSSATGGNIETTSKARIYGNILAADHFIASHDTSVNGYIVASAQVNPNGENKLSNKLIIDLRKIPSSFDPTKMPIMTGETNAPDVKIAWTKYL